MYLRLNPIYQLKRDYLEIMLEPRILQVNRYNNPSYVEISPSLFEFLKLCDGSMQFSEVIESLAKLYEDQSYVSLAADYEDVLEPLVAKQIIILQPEQIKSEVKVIDFEQLIIPSAISLEVTDKCQLECKHCFNSYNQSTGNFVDFEKLNDFLILSRKIGIQAMFLTGGELLLHPQIEQIIDEVTKSYNSVTIATNGYKLINASIIKRIMPLNVTVQISIDGDEAYHNQFRGRKTSYENAYHNLRNLINHQVQTQVAYTVNTSNVKYIEEQIIKARDLGVSVFTIGALTLSGNAIANNLQPLEINEFIELTSRLSEMYTTDDFMVSNDCSYNKLQELADAIPHPNKCGAGNRVLHFDPNLSVYPCASLTKIKLGENADLNLMKIIDISNSAKTLDYASPTPKLCRKCMHDFKCGGCLGNKLIELENKECILADDKHNL